MMAFTMILIAVVLFTGTNVFGHFGFGGPQWMAPLPLPQLPGFPRLPSPPPLLSFGFHHIPNFGPPLPSIPTQEDIKNTKPRPGQTYTGVSISTQSHVNRDEDGNIIKTGGTVLVVNDNGNVMTSNLGNPPKTTPK